MPLAVKARRMPIVRWPEERFIRLCELVAEGKTSYEMAAILGITRNAVMGKLHRNRIRIPRRTAEQRPKPKHKPVKIQAEKPRPPTNGEITLPSLAEQREAANGPAVSFAGLKRHHCRWPLWGLNTSFEHKLFCGKRKVEGSPYCEEHTDGAHTAHVRRLPKAPFRAIR